MKFNIFTSILAVFTVVSCSKDERLSETPPKKSDDGPTDSRTFDGEVCVDTPGSCLYTDIVVTPSIESDVDEFDNLVGSPSTTVADYFNGSAWESFLSHLETSQWEGVLSSLQRGECIITKTENSNGRFYVVRLADDTENHIHVIPVVD